MDHSDSLEYRRRGGIRAPILYTNMGSKQSIHLIVDNGSEKNFVSEDLMKKLGLVTTPHPYPYNIGWMKDRQELRIT